MSDFRQLLADRLINHTEGETELHPRVLGAIIERHSRTMDTIPEDKRSQSFEQMLVSAMVFLALNADTIHPSSDVRCTKVLVNTLGALQRAIADVRAAFKEESEN